MVRRRDDLVIGPKEKAIEAVKAGNKEDAIKNIEALYEEFRPLHDRYGDWVQILLSFIAEKLGEEAVEEAVRGITYEIYDERWLTRFKDMSPEEIAAMFGQVLRSHYASFYIEEDDEKLVVYIPYCGSGGRMQKEGRAAAGRRTQKAYPWSYGQAGVCYYCTHESIFEQVFHELGFDIIKWKYEKQFEDDGTPTGGVCRIIVYKKKPKS